MVAAELCNVIAKNVVMYRKDSNVEINDEVSHLISLLEKETNTDDKTREDVRKLSSTLYWAHLLLVYMVQVNRMSSVPQKLYCL